MPFRRGDILVLQQPGGSPETNPPAQIGDLYEALSDEDYDTTLVNVRRISGPITRYGQSQALAQRFTLHIEDGPNVDRFVCWNETTQRILPLTGLDGGTRRACLDQIARWFSSAARTADQRQNTTFHLVPLRSVERVNINGVIEEDTTNGG